MTAAVVSASDWITVAQPAVAFGSMGAGGTATGDRAVRMAVTAAAPDLEACPLRIEVTSDQGAWTLPLDLPIAASRLESAGVTFSAGDPLPGTSGDLVIDLVNAGKRDLYY